MKKSMSKSNLSRYATLFCAACFVLLVSACDNNASSNNDGGQEVLSEEERRERCDRGDERFCSDE